MKLQAIAKESHALLGWQHPQSYQFAAKEALVPLAAFELVKATPHFPIVFVAHGEQFAPMALLGLQQGQNLFVALDGRWLAAYVPAALRAYPFQIASDVHGQRVLCIDGDCGLIDEAGEPFFTDGEPSQGLREILGRLTEAEQARQAIIATCSVLHKHKLIVPWPITVQGAQSKQEIEGLFKIDEAALTQLDAPALHDLMQTGAMSVAYCQMLSMQHLQRLGELAQAHAQVADQKTRQTQELAAQINAFNNLDLDFLTKGDVLTLGNL